LRELKVRKMRKMGMEPYCFIIFYLFELRPAFAASYEDINDFLGKGHYKKLYQVTIELEKNHFFRKSREELLVALYSLLYIFLTRRHFSTSIFFRILISRNLSGQMLKSRFGF